MITKREILAGGLGLMLPQVSWADGVINIPLKMDADGDLGILVSINGQGPFLFRLKAGQGVSSIPISLAKQVNLRLIGDAVEPYSVFVGGQEYPGFRVNAANVRFADVLTRRNMVFFRLPGRAFDGIYRGEIGSLLLTEQPSILDLEAAELRVYPDGRMSLDGFVPIPAVVKRSGVNPSQNPSSIILACRLAGVNAPLGLSTRGDRIILWSGFVREHKLWDRFADYTETFRDEETPPRPEGEKSSDLIEVPKTTSKVVKWRTVRLKDVSIGSIHFDDVEVRMNNPELGGDNQELGGFIGGNLLSRFALACGKKNEVWIKPGSDFQGQVKG